MLKKVVWTLLLIVLLLLGVAALLPASYTLERSIVIERPAPVVYGLVSDYNAWLEWSPWPKSDPAAKHEVTGEPGAIGMKWAWNGEEVGIGSMTLTAVEPNRSIHSKLAFVEPMSSQADDYLQLEPTEGGTRVTWRNQGDLAWPVGRYFGLGLEGMLGPQYEQGLRDLKALAESRPLPPVEDAAAGEAAPGPEGADAAPAPEAGGDTTAGR